jgi:hypothetical protein
MRVGPHDSGRVQATLAVVSVTSLTLAVPGAGGSGDGTSGRSTTKVNEYGGKVCSTTLPWPRRISAAPFT